jgi:hypothetical protein
MLPGIYHASKPIAFFKYGEGFLADGEFQYFIRRQNITMGIGSGWNCTREARAIGVIKC